MKRPALRVPAILPALLAATTGAAVATAQNERITEANAINPGARERITWFSSPPGVRWAEDGALEVRDGKTWRVYDPETDTFADRKALDEPSTDRPDRDTRRRIRRRSEPGKDILTTSPDGAWRSWVDDSNNLVLQATTEGARAERVTTNGGAEMFNGKLDWVYQEEIYGRGNFRGHWWGPNSKFVAFLRLDESPVREFTVIDHAPDGYLETERTVQPEISNYPKAGDPNPVCTVHVYDVAGGEVRQVDLSAFPEDLLVMRVGFTPTGDRVVLMIQDRIQTWMELVYADPGTGAVERVLREESSTWVNRPDEPLWLPDGTFLWMSERTGYQHVYHYQGDGTLVRPVTQGDWQVRDIEHVGFDARLMWFEGTKDRAIDRNLYRIRLDGTGMTRLTTGEGRHSWRWNDDRSWFTDTVSSVETPPEVRLCRGDTGEVVKVLGKAEAASAAKYSYHPKRRLVIPARDGYLLDATVVPAAAPGDGRKRGIYLSTYSGPDAPSVRNAFQVSTLEQFLAQEGVMTLQVNVRTASGRGQVHTGLCYKQLGVQELRDLEDAVRFALREFDGDPTRVAIAGWSYGGFMAAYALTHSDVFTLGFAGAGVHDWQLYDTIYTERYMSTPQLNPEGYTKASVVKSAENLTGHLVIMHGTMDDNVHLQNSILLAHELQRAGQQNFEMMFYARSRHGVRSPHLSAYRWRVLKREFAL